MNPFIEENIVIEADPNSGTADYDAAKDAGQLYLDASRSAEGVLKNMGPVGDMMAAGLRGWRRGITASSHHHSSGTADWMLQKALAGNPDAEVNARLNFGFFTHNLADDDDPRHMSLNKINIDVIVRQFAGNNSDEWPNLLLNSSHARVNDTISVSGIMEGFHALASDCFRDHNGRARELNLIMHHDYRSEKDSILADQQKSKPTILLSAVFNNHNAWGNGATLLYRINHLDALYEKEKHGKITSQREREKEYCGEGLACMSPASIMLAKLILKLIAENPEEIIIPNKETFERCGTYYQNKIYVGDMTKLLTGAELAPINKPIQLRTDAGKILQHILPEGYSKGGNIISDAVRFLMLDLQRPLSVDSPNSPSAFEVDGKSLERNDVSKLIFNLGILAVNPGCTPFTPYEEEMGLRRLIVASTRDNIIRHLIKRPVMQDLRMRKPDGRQGYYEITPLATLSGLGHGFLDALGRSGLRKKAGYIADPNQLETDTSEKQKLAHEVRSRLRVIHAACYNALGVSGVKEKEDGLFELEFSRGADFDRIKAITQKLQQIISDAKEASQPMCDPETGICQISIPKSNQASMAHYTPKSQKDMLADALKILADPKRQNGAPELFVGDHVYHALGHEPPALERLR